VFKGEFFFGRTGCPQNIRYETMAIALQSSSAFFYAK